MREANVFSSVCMFVHGERVALCGHADPLRLIHLGIPSDLFKLVRNVTDKSMGRLEFFLNSSELSVNSVNSTN